MRSLALTVSLQCFVALTLLLAVPCPTHAITYDLVPVGDAGNAADTTGYGAVAYEYQIGKYDVTIGQYTAFLNAVAATDTHGLYDLSMGTDLNVAGISRAGASGSYVYSAINNGGDSSNRPITYVNWGAAARFANWMANGTPSGLQSHSTTENGAYTMSSGGTRNATNPNTGSAPIFFIPSENEWYKSAYFSPTLNTGSGGYYTYATQNNVAPGNAVGANANQANWFPGNVYAVTQSTTYARTQNYLTSVGAFTNSTSFYGTYDQTGLVWQWTDITGSSGNHAIRGGNWEAGEAYYVSSAYRYVEPNPGYGDKYRGFRLAAPVAVPEPSTCCSLAAGIAFGCWRLRCRRTQATKRSLKVASRSAPLSGRCISVAV
jgi:sulfatase modifying factor 1